MSAEPTLRLVDPETGELHADAPPYAELIQRIRELEDTIAGHEQTLRKQSHDLGRLERKRREETDSARHPKAQEIADLIERWKKATDHPNAKASKDRVDLIKARLKDCYTIEQLALAIDGLGGFPYVVNGQRRRTGPPSQRYDKLSTALGGGEAVERFANLGAQVSREQETP
ncbi:MAG: hypothetical protein ACREMB_13740 [Candidatus Rokuibacteriota bacterium]